MSLPIKTDALDVVSGGAANPKLTAGTADPTLGLSRPEGSIYLRYVVAGGQAFIKFGAADTDWDVIATGGGGIGGSLDDAYDFGGAGAGRIIAADSGSVRIDAGTNNSQAALEIQRLPGAASAALGIDLSLNGNVNASGVGIQIADGGAGTSLKVTKSNSGSVYFADLTNVGAKALEVVVTAAPTSVSPISVVANTTGTTATLVSISKIPGGATAGNALSVSMGANTTGAAVSIAAAGTGPAIQVTAGAVVVGAANLTKTGFSHEFTKDAANVVVASSYGTGLNTEFMAFRGRGTGASTTAVLSGDVLGAFSYAGATTATAIKSGAFHRALATENWSATANGTKLETYTIPNTTSTAVLRTTLDQDGVLYVNGGGIISIITSSGAGFFNSAMFTAGGASTSFTQADRELRIQQGANAGGQRYQYLTFNGRWSGNIDSPTLTQGLFDRVCGIEFDAAADSLGPNPNASINFFVNTGTKGTGAELVVTPTRAMTITYTARVGIGTTDPTAKLDVRHSASPAIDAIQIYNTAGGGGDGRATLLFRSDVTSSKQYSLGIDVLGGTAKSFDLRDITGGAVRFSVSTTGVATFSGVAATNSLILTTGNGLISNGQLQVTRDHATDGQIFVQGSNAGNAQPSAIGFLNQAASFRSYVGYFPSSYAFTYLRTKNGFFAQTGEDFVHADATNSTVVINHANRRVGIGAGLTSPLYTLDLRGSTTASRVHFGFSTTDDGGYLISAQASQALMAGGMSYDGTQFIAKATAVGGFDIVGGEYLWYNNTGQTIGAAATAPVRMKLYAAGGLEIGNSDSATVSAAGFGKIRYNTSGQKFQVSMNGAAYVDLQTGADFTLDIGDAIGSSTVGSVLFVGAGNVLQQDNANFFWNDTDNTLGLGTAGPLSNYRLSVTTVTGGSGIQITGANTASYSGLDFYDSAAAFAGSVGYGNSAVAIAHVQSRLFHYSASADWVFANATRNEITLGMTTGSTFQQMQNGSGAAVSDASTGRIRYTTTGQKFQVSTNGGAYVDLATAGGPTVERLSADGAADPAIDRTFVSGSGTDLTLANGTIDGFIKSFVVTGGTGTITPANLADGDVLTWTATPANVDFIWDATNTTWHVIGNPYNMVTT
jgi:hypothetical protein